MRCKYTHDDVAKVVHPERGAKFRRVITGSEARDSPRGSVSKRKAAVGADGDVNGRSYTTSNSI